MRVLLGVVDIAAIFNVKPKTVSMWRLRYADFPEPDITIGDVSGWEPGRIEEFRDWESRRPGQGRRGEHSQHGPGRPAERRARRQAASLGLDAGTEQRLTSWAAIYASRDLLIRQALADGVSKHRIHVLTGIARTTIDRISREA